MTYKNLTDFDETFRVVVTFSDDSTVTQETIDDILGCIGYASKANLRMSEPITLKDSQILGRTLIVDVYCDLTKSNSDDATARIPEFIRHATSHIINGKYMTRADGHIGGYEDSFVQFLIF